MLVELQAAWICLRKLEQKPPRRGFIHREKLKNQKHLNQYQGYWQFLHEAIDSKHLQTKPGCQGHPHLISHLELTVPESSRLI